MESCPTSWQSQEANWFAPGASQKAQELAQSDTSEDEAKGKAKWKSWSKKQQQRTSTATKTLCEELESDSHGRSKQPYNGLDCILEKAAGWFFGEGKTEGLWSRRSQAHRRTLLKNKNRKMNIDMNIEIPGSVRSSLSPSSRRGLWPSQEIELRKGYWCFFSEMDWLCCPT